MINSEFYDFVNTPGNEDYWKEEGWKLDKARELIGVTIGTDEEQIKEENNYIINNYKHKTDQEIADYLALTIYTVKGRRRKLGLRKRV